MTDIQYRFKHLQIFPIDVRSIEEWHSFRPTINPDCRDSELPANGDCARGWWLVFNTTYVIPDPTATIECLDGKT